MVWSAPIPVVPFLACSWLFDGPQAVLSSLSHVQVGTWLAVAYLAFAATLFGYSVWGSLLGRYETWRVAPLTLLVPLVGLFAAWLLLDEALSPAQFGGALLVLAGMAVNTFGCRAAGRRSRVKPNRAILFNTLSAAVGILAPVNSFSGAHHEYLPSMAAFALAASITPGPVNIVALSAGAQFGFGATQRHVFGATLGFTLLLVLLGLGMHQLLTLWPALTRLIQWAGVAFLLFMAYRLTFDDGRLGNGAARAPSCWYGALMQWLNPKAWLASVASLGAFVGDGDIRLLWQFAGLYFVICYTSVACWAYVGAMLRGLLRQARNVRRFNRTMALLLAASACYLLAEGFDTAPAWRPAAA